MSGQTYENQTVIRAAIQEYITKHGITSLRKIAKYVYEKTGIHPPASTISRLLRTSFGYARPKVEWRKVK